MNLLPTKSSSSSLIVSIGNTKTANLPYQAPIIVLLYPRVRFSKWSSDLRYQALRLEIWNRRPTIWGPDLRYQALRVKSSIFNHRTTISDPHLRYQASCIVLDFQNEALTYDIKPLGGKYETETADLPYQVPAYDINPLTLVCQYTASNCNISDPNYSYNCQWGSNFGTRKLCWPILLKWFIS